jgi:hypothetical protein
LEPTDQWTQAFPRSLGREYDVALAVLVQSGLTAFGKIEGEMPAGAPHHCHGRTEPGRKNPSDSNIKRIAG